MLPLTMRPRPGGTAAQLRRSLPMPLVRALVRARVALESRRPASMARARAEIGHLLGSDHRQLDRLARDYLAWELRRAELRWHPDVVGDQQVEGVEHVTAAAARGKGVLLSFLHHAHFEGAFPALRAAGVDLDLVVDPLMVSDDAPDFVAQHAYVCSTGGRLHSVEMGSRGVIELLGAARNVGMALDAIGRTPVEFLGQPRIGSFGLARIAHEHDVPVVPMTFWPHGRTQRVQLGEPVEPVAFGSAGDLLSHLLGVHEASVRAWPQAYDRPLRRWGVAA